MQATYWNGNGRFEEQSRQVRALGLIPQEGEAVDPLAETLRKCQNAYYDIYNNGACNPCRFEGMIEILNTSTIDDKSKEPLSALFQTASHGRVAIQFDSPIPIDQEYPAKVFSLEEFERPLEELLDWAIQQTWLHHCCG
jgi:hypothetical protein